MSNYFIRLHDHTSQKVHSGMDEFEIAIHGGYPFTSENDERSNS